MRLVGVMRGPTPAYCHAAGAGRHRGNDALRGLAILAVVVTHTTAEWSAFPPEHRFAELHLLVRPALDIWIPWFLLVSGYYLGREDVVSWADYRSYLARRVERIVPPYLLWATILFVIGVAGGTWRASDYLVGIVNGRFAYPFYFVSVLIKLYLFYPVLAWTLDRPVRAALTLAGAGGLWFYGCLPDDPLGLRTTYLAEALFRRTVHAEWGVFFLLGVFFRRRTRPGPPATATPGWVPAAVVVGVVAAIAVAGFVGYGRILPGHAVGVLGVLVFLAVNTIPGEHFGLRWGLLAGLGVRSYSIYLLHEPWLQWSKYLLGAVVSDHPLLAQVPLLVVALGVPLALRWAAGAWLGARAAWITG